MTARVMSVASRGGVVICPTAPAPGSVPLVLLDVPDEHIAIVPSVLTKDVGSTCTARSPVSVQTGSVAEEFRRCVQGTVKEEGVPVVRKVGIYSRTTQQLLVSTTSGLNGIFKAEWIGSDDIVYAVILSDETTGYNAKVFDFLEVF